MKFKVKLHYQMKPTDNLFSSGYIFIIHFFKHILFFELNKMEII